MLLKTMKKSNENFKYIFVSEFLVIQYAIILEKRIWGLITTQLYLKEIISKIY